MPHESPHPARGCAVILALERPQADIESGDAFAVEDEELAAVTGLDVADVQATIERLYLKTGSSSRAELIAWARRHHGWRR